MRSLAPLLSSPRLSVSVVSPYCLVVLLYSLFSPWTPDYRLLAVRNVCNIVPGVSLPGCVVLSSREPQEGVSTVIDTGCMKELSALLKERGCEVNPNGGLGRRLESP